MPFSSITPSRKALAGFGCVWNDGLACLSASGNPLSDSHPTSGGHSLGSTPPPYDISIRVPIIIGHQESEDCGPIEQAILPGLTVNEGI
jgi:hypothetical protein